MTLLSDQNTSITRKSWENDDQIVILNGISSGIIVTGIPELSAPLSVFAFPPQFLGSLQVSSAPVPVFFAIHSVDRLQQIFHSLSARKTSTLDFFLALTER